jgi:hypothetical protein
LGWDAGEILYHTALSLLFAYAGFATGEAAVARAMVGGLGGLVILVGAVEILAAWFLPWHLVLYPHDATCLLVGIGSFLAAKFLIDDKPVS